MRSLQPLTDCNLKKAVARNSFLTKTETSEPEETKLTQITEKTWGVGIKKQRPKESE